MRSFAPIHIYYDCTKRLTCFSGDSPQAVGLGVRFIKLGGLLRGERTAKYNRLLAIEEDLTHSGTLGRQKEFEFPPFGTDPESLSCPEESSEEDKNGLKVSLLPLA
ncbi:hypothetical protein GDO78_021913 [Eleutherodactylus coqui]|uniref:phosphopyruvate hydratase n=1 Tax=Eleutherodactylus coqui TaxID=57060 RepID=A0A8J6E9R1_ELECQ|nr:hypothetical protein GDO78_021913 [Eleutherodactylus coqui]